MGSYSDMIDNIARIIKQDIPKVITAAPGPASQLSQQFLLSRTDTGDENAPSCEYYSALMYVLCLSVYKESDVHQHTKTAIMFELVAAFDKLRQSKLIDSSGCPFTLSKGMSMHQAGIVGNMLQSFVMSQIYDLERVDFSAEDALNAAGVVSRFFLELVNKHLSIFNPENLDQPTIHPLNATGLAAEVAATLCRDSVNLSVMKRVGLEFGEASRLWEELRCFQIIRHGYLQMTENIQSIVRLTPVVYLMKANGINFKGIDEKEDVEIARLIGGLLADDGMSKEAYRHTSLLIENRLHGSSQLIGQITGPTSAKAKETLLVLIDHFRHHMI